MHWSLCVFTIVDLLESFENHPPIVLPSAGFKVDLESDCVEDSIYRQLLYVRHFLWGLRTKTHPSNGCADRQDTQVMSFSAIHTDVQDCFR